MDLRKHLDKDRFKRDFITNIHVHIQSIKLPNN